MLMWINNVTFWPNLNVAFWGIPKSGSTTVKNHLLFHDQKKVLPNVMSVHKPKHLTFLPPVYKENALNFTVVRHPYSRFASMYTDFFKYRPIYRPKASAANLDKSWTDLQFIDYISTQRIGQLNHHFRPQAWFLKDSRITVFRLETLTTDWNLNIPPPEKRLNISAEVQYEPSEEVKRKIDVVYKEDFEIWETRTVKV